MARTAGSTGRAGGGVDHADHVELPLFEEVGEVVRGLVPPELGELHVRARRYGIKVWFGAAAPPRAHYEAQVISADHTDDAKVLALEIGFHAEHPEVGANDEIVERLVAAERRWRRGLGREAVLGPFLGRPDQWRRCSETWPDPDLDDTELAMEVGARLTDYVVALEPVLRSGTASRRR